MKVLIIEDNTAFGDWICGFLSKHGMETDVFRDGKSGFRINFSKHYDMILMNMELPQMSGIKVLKKLRANRIFTPVIMLAEEGMGEKCIKCLELGADDYIEKPFTADELTARIKAVARRCGVSAPDADMFEFGDIEMYPVSKKLASAKGIVELGEREWNLMECFVKNYSIVLSSENLARGAWNDGGAGDVELCVEYIKRKLEIIGSEIRIFKINGLGYKICVNE